MSIVYLISAACAGLPVDQAVYNPACNRAIEAWSAQSGVTKMADDAEKKLQDKARAAVVTYTGDKASLILFGTAYMIQHKELRLTTNKLSPLVQSTTISAKPDGGSIGFSWGF